MKCKKCSYQYEEGVCLSCFNQFQNIAWNNLIKPDPYFDFKIKLDELKYNLYDRLDILENSIKDLSESIKKLKGGKDKTYTK